MKKPCLVSIVNTRPVRTIEQNPVSKQTSKETKRQEQQQQQQNHQAVEKDSNNDIKKRGLIHLRDELASTRWRVWSKACCFSFSTTLTFKNQQCQHQQEKSAPRTRNTEQLIGDKKQEHSYLQSSVINPEKTPKEGEADRTVWSLI